MRLSRTFDYLTLVLVTLWVGGGWIVGYLAVPTLFSMLPDRMLAGQIAGRLFYVMGWLGLGCGGYILFFSLIRLGWSVVSHRFFWVMILMLVLIATSQFGIQPLMEELKQAALPNDVMSSEFRQQFSTWHGVSSILYLVQSLLGVILLCQIVRLVRD